MSVAVARGASHNVIPETEKQPFEIEAVCGLSTRNRRMDKKKSRSLATAAARNVSKQSDEFETDWQRAHR